jgi:hypothetical protein
VADGAILFVVALGSAVFVAWTAAPARAQEPGQAVAPVSGQRAQPPPPAERLDVYSPYEQQTIEQVLVARQLHRDAHPEGKRIERIDVVTLDPFEQRDAIPQSLSFLVAPRDSVWWLNVLHVTSRESIIRREVLLREGGRFEQAVADDTIRDLRRLPGVPQLSVVLVVAAEGSTPDDDVVLVITKDVWSLRLNWNVVGDAGGLDQLYLNPSENNFLGTHQIVGATFVLEPSAYTVGLNYFVPRLGSSRIAVVANANVMLNRSSGSAEGTYGELVAGQPRFSGTTPWSWDASVQFYNIVYRRYVNAALGAYVDPACQDEQSPSCRMPFEFRERVLQAGIGLTRSFGWDVKHDVTLALSAVRGAYEVNAPPTTSPQTVADFTRQAVPVADTRIGPAVQYHTYRTRFVRVLDFDTLGLQEDYRLGHDVIVRATPTLRAFGSTRDVVDLYGAAQYTWAVRDGLVRLSFQSETQPQLDGGRISDAMLEPSMHLATPTIAGLGRLVVDGTFLWRWRNYLNQTVFLGGDDRLRGYPTNFFVGANILGYNVEARSRSIEILSCELGAVAFYDVGDAYTNGSSFVPYQATGVGIRALFPWLDRTVFRVDVGFPLRRPIDPASGAPVPPMQFIVTFGQAFVTPTVFPAPALPTGQGADSP